MLPAPLLIVQTRLPGTEDTFIEEIMLTLADVGDSNVLVVIVLIELTDWPLKLQLTVVGAPLSTLTITIMP